MSAQTVYRLISPKGLSGLSKLQERIPSPKANEVLVRIHAVSLNYRDLMIVNGTYGLPVLDKSVLCSDMAGEVVHLGEGSTRFKVGDRVTALTDQASLDGTFLTGEGMMGSVVDGVLQEEGVFNERGLLAIPTHLTYEEAACFPGAGNALYGGGSSPIAGKTALVQGTGGAAIFCLAFASAAGMRTIVTSSSDEKLELARKLGATYGINYKATPDWPREVNKLTNDVGAHVIFDNVGQNGLADSFACVARLGTVNCIGFMAGKPNKVLDVPVLALDKAASLRAIRVGSRQEFEGMLRFVEARQYRPHIDKVFKFEETVQALEYLERGKHVGKIVIRVSEGQ